MNRNALIRQYIEAHGASDISTIAAGIGQPRASVARSTWDMRDKGLLVREGERYAIGRSASVGARGAALGLSKERELALAYEQIANIYRATFVPAINPGPLRCVA